MCFGLEQFQLQGRQDSVLDYDWLGKLTTLGYHSLLWMQQGSCEIDSFWSTLDSSCGHDPTPHQRLEQNESLTVTERWIPGDRYTIFWTLAILNYLQSANSAAHWSDDSHRGISAVYMSIAFFAYGSTILCNNCRQRGLSRSQALIIVSPSGQRLIIISLSFNAPPRACETVVLSFVCLYCPWYAQYCGARQCCGHHHICQ